LESQSKTTVAGRQGEPGNCDGHGANARFNKLKVPVRIDAKRFLVRDQLPGGATRICFFDLATHEVSTVDVRGVETLENAMCGFVFPDMLLLAPDGVLYHANLSEDVHASTFSSDMCTVNWSEPVEVQFLLAPDVVVNADRRFLCARSQYFSAMLQPGFREAQGLVDLTASAAEPDAFRAVLAYLMTDELNLEEAPLLDQALLCLRVAALSDQYQLQRLVGLAVTFVVRVALPHDSLVLTLLEQTLDSGSRVEQACWDAVGRRPVAVCESTEMTQLFSRTPQLAARLSLHLARLVATPSALPR